MAFDPGMNDRLVHHRGVEIIATTCAFHFRRVQYHAKTEEAPISATTTDRAISLTIAAIEDRKSDSNEHGKATVSAKRRSISRLPGESTSLDTA